MTPERLSEITLQAQAEAEKEYPPSPKIGIFEMVDPAIEEKRAAYAAALVKSAVRAGVLLEVLHDLRHGSFDSEQAVNDRIDAALHAFKNQPTSGWFSDKEIEAMDFEKQACGASDDCTPGNHVHDCDCAAWEEGVKWGIRYYARSLLDQQPNTPTDDQH